MSALRAKTASLLLGRISEQDRITVIRDVTRSLDELSSNADIGLAAALWKLEPDQETQNELVSHLRRMVERNDSDRVAAICRDHEELEGELLSNAIPRMAEAADLLRRSAQRSIIVPWLETDPKSNEHRNLEETSSDEALSSTTEQARQLLAFFNRIMFRNVDAAQATSLLQSCLVLVGAADKKLSQVARETLFSLFSLPQTFDAREQERIWKRIESLVTFEDAYYKSLGFSLWLRWLSDQRVEPSILKEQTYWDLIVDGLRKGDSERRKSALQILRASINASLADPLLTSMIAAGSQSASPGECPGGVDIVAYTESDIAPEAIEKQYHRFASTFETIVLGRYLNQVMECEPDLDFLSSSQSVVRPVFLYTLLASALDQKLQDSNRKFIGTWIMRSNLRTDDTDEFMTFFRDDFLPWVTAGTLFTSSLGKHQLAQLRSQHGDNLTRYVSSLVKNYPQRASGIIDCILDGILARHGNNFAYGMVYLVEGIAHALENTIEVKPTVAQLERLHKIATYAGLPEVVRDYALARSWKLCFEHVQSMPAGDKSSDVVVSAAQSWEELRAKSESLGSMASTQKDGNIASLALAPSKREANEQIALQKCRDLVNETSNTLDAEKLDDIWSDLEYLEYPKGLLAALPELILHPGIIKSALSAPSDDLTETLAKHTKSILELADSRSYLLPPLVASIRTVALQYPQSTPLLNVDELIIHLAGHPPAPTMDAMLEEATINLLQPINPRTEKFSYEFYSGLRESYGFAALIDLASRLDVDLSRQILNSLLQRWVKQKTPAPAVSHWKTSLQLQVMLLCSEKCIPAADVQTAGKVLEDLHYILSIEPLPTYRYLMEWMIARVYIHHPTLRVAILEKLSTKDHHSNPKFLASLMKLGVMIAKTDGSAEEFATQLATAFVPLAASSKVVIRHEAQWQVPILLDHARKQDWKSVVGNTAFEALDEFIRSLERFEDPPLERQIDRLDPVEDHNLTHLVSGSWWGLDQVEQPLCRHQDLLKLYENDRAQGIALRASCLPLGPCPTTVTELASVISLPTQDTQANKTSQNIQSISQTLSNTNTSSTTALQTKGAAYLSSHRARHSTLLVIASLVDNPYNLGGLSRVSEIFGAGSLYVQNPTVTSTKDFLSVSVSSHHHIPILPLSAAGIQEFVAGKKKDEGFSVVGIEQTDRSKILGSEGCDLPRKCILVLGSEREGIPTRVLSECDVLVEIGQVGVTRSLNVQTAAGIVLNEYARQFRGVV